MNNSYISKLFIKNLLNSSNILEIASNYVNLKKKGNNYFSLCPFHIEKTPSFVINNDKQIFHCFGCGCHGNIIDFLMKINNLNFIEAVQEIGDFYHFTLHKNIKSNLYLDKQSETVYSLVNEISTLYHQYLLNYYPSIIDKFFKKRNITKQSIKVFFLGYAPSLDILVNTYQSNNKIIKILLDIGLIKKQFNNKLSDFFKNRLIFPISNKMGKIIGFGGRILIDSQMPKYLNSFNNQFFNKSNILYGLNKIIYNKSKRKILILVEGYLDVIKLHQYDINNVVGLLGSNISETHIKLLFQISNHIICCFDGDKAGNTCVWKFLTLALSYIKHEQQLFFMFLPDNKDPDEFLDIYGKEKFIKIMKKAIPFYQLLLNTLFNKIDISTLYGKAYLLSTIKTYLNKMNNESLKLVILEIVYQRLNIIDKHYYHNFFLKPNNNHHHLITHTNNHPINLPMYIKLLISLLIQNPKLLLHKLIPKCLLKLKYLYNIDKNLKISKNIINNLINIFDQNDHLTIGKIIECFRFSPYNVIINNLIIWDNMISKVNIIIVFKDIILQIIKLDVKTQFNILIAKDKYNALNIKEKVLLNKLIKFLTKK